MNARDRILLAFRELVLSEPFDELKLQDVIGRAGIARSTFYAHFNSKNDLLLSSLDPILSVLAEACRGAVEPGLLISTLEHVWENRAVGRVFFRSPASDLLAREMVRMLQARRLDPSRSHFMVNGLLGLLGAWTAGQLPLTAAELAEISLRLTATLEETGIPSAGTDGSAARHSL